LPTALVYSSTCCRKLRMKWGANGCKKVIIVNGHGGNEHLLPFFAQAQLASPHDYIVYVFNRPSHSDLTGRPP